jgi:hypothetical protein
MGRVADDRLGSRYPSSVLLKTGRVLTVYYAVGRKESPWRVHGGAVIYQAPSIP